MTMKQILLYAFLAAPLALISQSMERQVIASTGGYAETSTLQVTSTVGQTIQATASSTYFIITQGFQQPESGLVGVEEFEIEMSVDIYPNPTTEQLIIQILTPKVMRISARVLDMQGKEMGISFTNVHFSAHTQQSLDVSTLPTGQYLVSFFDEKSDLGTVIFQKVN